MSTEVLDRERGSIDYDLCSADEEVRRLAVERLSTLPEDEALPRLVESLGDDSWRVRKAAVTRMVHLQDAASSLGSLIRALADGESSSRRNSAVEALVRRGVTALPQLIEALGDDDADVRKQLVDVIAGIGDGSAAASMRRVLGDPDPNVSAAAADALGVLGGEGASGALRDLALDPGADPLVRVSSLRALARLEVPLGSIELAPVVDEPILRAAAFAVLAHSEDEAAVEVLLKGLSVRASSSRHAAVASLVSMMSRSDGVDAERLVGRIRETAAANPSLVDAIVASLDADDLAARIVRIQFLSVAADARATVPILHSARDEALRDVVHAALETFGDAAEDAIDEAWDQLGLDLHLEACSVLAQTAGQVGARRLQRLLDEPDAVLRRMAIEALGARRCREAMAALVRRLELASDEDEEACEETRAVVAALGAIGSRDGDDGVAAELVASLGARIDGAPDAVRLAITEVLGQVGSQDEIRPLSLLLKDPSPRVRRAAVEALARLVQGGDSEPLRLALADESSSVRIAAARALGASRGENALEDLERLTTDEDLRVRAAAVRALGEQGQRGESVFPFVLTRIEVALGDEPSVAIAAAEALTELGGPAAARVAVRLLDHDAAEVVQAAVACIAAGGDAECLGELLRLIAHSEWSVRAGAIQALGERHCVRAVPSILRRLETEQDSFVRETILSALRRLEG